MILKALTLKNIRSYVEQQIEFPSGSLLLAGDIGSGKSTILLAIEFALFGLLRGDVEGTALLRHGSREGHVELSFELEGKEYSIRRVLKRTKDRVAQDAGWLMHDGIRKDGTAQELKAWILELLGYPKEFLSKSKSLLFRYTVFTPQEEMKRILFEDKEARLETLRRVFDVDKYKRIKENATIYVRSLKEERKRLEGFTQDLEGKKRTLQLKVEEGEGVRLKLTEVKSTLEDAKQKTTEQKEAVAKHEESVRDAQKLRSELNVTKTSLAHHESALKRSKSDRERTENQLKVVKGEVLHMPPKAPETLKKDIEDKNSKVAELERVLRESHAAVAQITTGKSYSNDLKQKVSSMNNCPVCLQTVTQDHKNRISFAEDQKLHKLEDLMRRHIAAKDQFESQMRILKQDLDVLRKQESESMLMLAKQKSLKEKEEQIATISKTIENTQEQVDRFRKKQEELLALVEATSQAEDTAKKAKQHFDLLMAEERKIEIEHIRLVKELEGIDSFAKTVEVEVKEKVESKKKLEKVSIHQSWLTDHFSNIMDVMEKHVLARVHHEFNELFQRWFSLLIEDELLTGRLDDSFAPVMNQNGYDVDIAHLSGGEKTACALAYRLALNKVINDIVSSIKTKDVLILDEPTDGFSSEQLDKVRDVLEQLLLKQVIIVSHETKIESMVDSVLKVEKDSHISKVIA